jgi:hypothetical protein
MAAALPYIFVVAGDRRGWLIAPRVYISAAPCPKTPAVDRDSLLWSVLFPRMGIGRSNTPQMQCAISVARRRTTYRAENRFNFIGLWASG